MDDIHYTNVELGESSDSEIMEHDTVLESEQQVKMISSKQMDLSEADEQRLTKKRARQEDGETVEDDGFVRVVRGHKRINRMNSQRDDITISVTGKEILPKQFGMAKLLRSCGIQNIERITYKSAHRALIYFENKESASKC